MMPSSLMHLLTNVTFSSADFPVGGALVVVSGALVVAFGVTGGDGVVVVVVVEVVLLSVS